MNTFLVIFLVVLLSYAGVWVGIALSYYRVRHLSYVPIHLAIKYWTPHETNSSKVLVNAPLGPVYLFIYFLCICVFIFRLLAESNSTSQSLLRHQSIKCLLS